MTISPFARMRFHICAMLLLAFATALLPARHASADTQTVVIPKELVDQSVWNANWTASAPLPAHKVESLLETELALNAGFAVAADLNNLHQTYVERLGPRGADPAFRHQLPPEQIVQAMFDAASSLPLFRHAAKTTWEELNSLVVLDDPTAEELARDVRAYSYGQSVLDRQDTVLKATLERTKRDPQFADTFDQTIGQLLGVSSKGFDGKAFVESHPNLPVPPKVREGIRPDGTLAISLDELKELATTEFDKVNASIGDLQLTIDRINLQQKDLVDYMKDERARHEAEALAKAKAQEHELKLVAADSAIFVVSTLASFIDPKVGNQIATVGHAALQIGESLNGWMAAVSGLNTLEALTSLSTVVMTGNVLGAVVSIVGLFGSSGPSPEQIILEEIGKLRKQVDQLRTEMHERFDHVDEELNTIYATMQDRFNNIDVQLGKLNGSLQEIQTSLVTLSLALSRIERNNFAYLDALGRRPLREAMNGALGYKRRTGLDMPYQPDFVGYENTFHTWGTVNAFDALSAGPAERDYSDSQVLAELSAAPLDANLNYLNGWLAAHGLPPFASKRLPSPRDWAFATRVYARLGLDWPEHLRRIDPQRGAALDAVGNDLQQALQAIAAVSGSGGSQGNAALVNGVLAYYHAKLEAISAGLEVGEANFVHELWADGLHRSVPFDLFGGVSQPLTYQVAEFASMTCGGTRRGVETPSTINQSIPDFNRAILADYLGVSKLSVCLTGEWLDEEQECEPLPGHPPGCRFDAIPSATITVFIDTVAITSRSIQATRVDEQEWGGTPLAGFINAWAGRWKRQFEAEFARAVPLSPEAESQLAAITTALQNRLRGYQQDLYGRTVAGLSSRGLHPAAVELAGAKKLLDSFITLGFPQAVDSDDFLRSLLFSDQQLLDDQQVIAAYATRTAQLRAASAAGDDTALTTNPRLVLLAAGQKRAAALSSLLASYLDGISAGTYSEDSALLANTRLDLRLARSFANTDAPGPEPTPGPVPPAQRKAIFLPLVVRR